MSAYERLVVQIAQQARLRHSSWDQALFEALARTRGAGLARALGDADDAQRCLAGYLQLIAEAVGLGYVVAAELPADGSAHLLERCLIDVLPRRLPAYASGKRLELMARAFNIGEGLLRQPPWVARVVSALVPDLDDLAALDQLVARALEPLLVPSRTSGFKGPFAVRTVDLRPLDDAFLPGVLHAAAPAVVCVHDALRKGRNAAVLLQAEGRSRALGLTRCLGEVELWAEGARPAVELDAERVSIAGTSVEIWSVQRASASLLVPSGFAVLAAVDSQRLWVVESRA